VKIICNQIREHVETDLTDDALQRLIDAAEEDLGSETAVVEYFRGLGRQVLHLRRLASAISSVTEHKADGDLALVVPGLTTADMRLLQGRAVERLTTGTNPSSYWYEKTTVTYVPNDLSRRKQCVIDLVRLAVERRGVASEGTGDYRFTGLDYEAERQKIIDSLYVEALA
jgi:hypothetical protein